MLLDVCICSTKCMCASTDYALHLNTRLYAGWAVFVRADCVCIHVYTYNAVTNNQPTHIIKAYKLTDWLNEEIAMNSVGLHYIKMYVQYKYL